MALKPDRRILSDGTDISFFCNQTNEKGAVMILSAGGSGAAMDDSAALVTRPTVAYASGQVIAGILLCDVVSGDLTKTHLNQHKDEVQVGSKVPLLRKGMVTTNMCSGTITAGQGAYASDLTSGVLCSLAVTQSVQYSGANTVTIPTQYPRVGTWMSSKDSDGYAKLEVNLI